MNGENLITLREGKGQSVVLLHPASGLATAFRRLVPHLRSRGAVFAFENAEPKLAPSSIGDLAADYWSQLKIVAADPLLFAGWSFGGAVALEMASLAINAAHEVSAVVLLDAGAPHLIGSSPVLPLHDLAGLFGISPAELPADAAPVLDAEILAVLVGVLRRTQGMTQIEADDLQPFVAAYRWHHTVARRPWRFRGDRMSVYLLRARDERGWDDAPPDLGWSSVLGGPPITLWAPGTHHSLMSEEHAPDLARILSSLLSKTHVTPPRSVGGGET